MHQNLQARDAKRIVHELHHILCHIQAHELPYVAKALAVRFIVPQKLMLKTMARYTRIHHNY
jgi:hypothetical protein